MAVSTDAELVKAYLEHYATKDASLFWAFEQVQTCVSEDPHRAWSLTLQLIAAAPTDAALVYVAAGPLEDLLYARAELFIDDVECRARDDPKFRRALQVVDAESESPGDVYDRLNRAAAGTSN